MTLGTGIVVSTCLVLAFIAIYLVSKHHKWKLVFKLLGGLIVIGAIAGVGIWFYLEQENKPKVATELAGIKLGMPLVDITLSKGKPDVTSDLEESEETDNFFTQTLEYKNSSDSTLYIYLNGMKDSLKVFRICDFNSSSRVLDFNKYSYEEKIVEKLGNPSAVSIQADGNRKVISYPQWHAAFEIEKGKVITACVTKNVITYIDEYSEIGGKESIADEVVEELLNQ